MAWDSFPGSTDIRSGQFSSPELAADQVCQYKGTPHSLRRLDAVGVHHLWRFSRRGRWSLIAGGERSTLYAQLRAGDSRQSFAKKGVQKIG